MAREGKSASTKDGKSFPPPKDFAKNAHIGSAAGYEKLYIGG